MATQTSGRHRPTSDQYQVGAYRGCDGPDGRPERMDAPGTLDPRAGGLLRLCRPFRSEFPVVVADVRPRPDIRQPAPRTRRVPGPRHSGRPDRTRVVAGKSGSAMVDIGGGRYTQ